MARDDIKTTGDISRLLAEMESNVIPTGVGSVPNSPSAEVASFYLAAEMAARTTNPNPLAQLDTELLTTHSSRLDRLSSAITKGAAAARFKPKTPVTTATAPRAAATTITTQTGTVIRPVEAAR